MMGMMGKDPMDLLTAEQIDKVLTETFNKFDTDGSGELEIPEFRKAWEFLGLKGSRAEVDRAFQSVDSDGSGKVYRVEFKNAIKDSRVEELGMSVILSQMDGHLEGMEKIFADYKKKLEAGTANGAAAEEAQQKAIEA